MKTFEALINNYIEADLEFVTPILEDANFGSSESIEYNYLNYIDKEITKFKKTGKLSILDIEEFKEAQSVSERSSLKENEAPNRETLPKKRGRKKAIVTESNVVVKSEKLSNVYSLNSTSSNTEEQFNNASTVVKNECLEMPAPTRPAPRVKKIKTEVSTRITRTKSRNTLKQSEKKVEEQDARVNRKDSDVVLQNELITTITLSDSDDSFVESTNNKSKAPAADVTVTRATRTKTRAMQKKKSEEQLDVKSKKESVSNKTVVVDADVTRSTRTRTRNQKKKTKRSRTTSDTEEENPVEIKKSRSNSRSEEQNNTVQTEYEDALSSEEKNEIVNTTYATGTANATYVAVASSKAAVNSTVVIKNPKVESCALNDLLTDDESFENAKRTPPKPKSKKKQNQIFSPFEKTPVKQKVEAYEKLRAGDSSKLPTRINKSKAHEIECKPKPYTPMASRIFPKLGSTKSKATPAKNDTQTSIDSILSGKSASLLKASQAEYREREKLRQEKEREALKKREALLLAQTEEKRKKREEKQLKAQQIREQLERDKEKQLELQRQKELRHNKMVLEKEEKVQKQRAELENKRLLVKIKAQEIKEKEVKTEEKPVVLRPIKSSQKKVEPRELPIYMREKPPRLPCYDCYDSDEEGYENVKKVKQRLPDWMQESQIKHMQLAQNAAGESIKNTFFSCQAQTPDLLEIFERIDSRKLKRTSSAIWRKPPRYTMIPGLSSFDKISEDED